MKKAIYLNNVSQSPAVELHACHIREMLKTSDVTVYICNSSISACNINPFNRKPICKSCIYRATDPFLMEGVTRKEIDLSHVNIEVSNDVYEKLYLGVMSSLSSMTRLATEEEFDTKWRHVFKQMMISAQKMYNYFMKEISDNSYQEIRGFNGRFSDIKPVVEAAKTLDIDYTIYDVKKSINHYHAKNTSLHSVDLNLEKANRLYKCNPKKAKEVADNFFNLKEKGLPTFEKSFTEKQKKGFLPKDIENARNKGKKIISVFTSSDDEFRYVGGEWTDQVLEQTFEIKNLVRHLTNDYFVILRMHPNQRYMSSKVLDLYQLVANDSDRVLIIWPEDTVDTYAVIKASLCCVTFISTVGVEANYARKPVVNIGQAPYSGLNVSITVNGGVEAAEKIIDGVKTMPIEGAIIWANYLMEYRDHLPGFARKNNGEYHAYGQKIRSSRFYQILGVFARFEVEMSKPYFKWNKDFFLKTVHQVKNLLKNKWAVQ